jgi:hypothetical protein
MSSFGDVLSASIAEALATRRRNIIDWSRTKDVLGEQLDLDDQSMNISLVSHNNFHPRLRQKGFDGSLDLAVLVLELGTTFTDRVCEGLHNQRNRPDWPLLVITETPSGRFKGLRLILGPTNSSALKTRAEAGMPGLQVMRYESVWH